jgi:hypothetical protein
MKIGVFVVVALVVMFFAWAMVKGIGDEDEY